jgi:DNA-binding transcriptional ArsR family regulator
MIETFRALAEPHRLHIVQLLQIKPRSVGEIVEQIKLPQPQVSKHLRVLVEAGLVAVQPLAQRRIYKLNPQPFQELDTWLEPFRQILEERFDRLEQYLLEVQEGEIKSDEPE